MLTTVMYIYTQLQTYMIVIWNCTIFCWKLLSNRFTGIGVFYKNVVERINILSIVWSVTAAYLHAHTCTCIHRLLQLYTTYTHYECVYVCLYVCVCVCMCV